MNRNMEMPDRHFEGLGKCIFCLQTGKQLTREHIVPYGLSGRGEMFVKKGSCVECNSHMNQAFENPAMQNDLRDARAVLTLKRRKRKGQEPLLPHPVEVEGRNGERRIVSLPASMHPGLVSFLVTPPAGLLVGKERSGELEVVRTYDVQLTPDRAMFSMAMLTPKISGAVPQMIIKAAYAFAVVERGLDGFDGTEVRDLLCGRRGDIYNFIGEALEGEQPLNFEGDLHHFYLRERGPFLVVTVHLFASFGAPAWDVVVGRLPAHQVDLPE